METKHDEAPTEDLGGRPALRVKMLVEAINRPWRDIADFVNCRVPDAKFTSNYIHHIANRSHVPRSDTLDKLARGFGITRNYFVTDLDAVVIESIQSARMNYCAYAIVKLKQEFGYEDSALVPLEQRTNSQLWDSVKQLDAERTVVNEVLETRMMVLCAEHHTQLMDDDKRST